MHCCNNDNKNKDNNSGHKEMVWMMIPCLILLGVLFLGGGKLSGGGYFWPILIGVFVVTHVWIMFRGHGKHGNADAEEKVHNASAKQLDAKDEHKHDDCCH